jgi:gluconate 5-dehydrogenase
MIDPFSLKGKVALVTGSSRGMGLAMATSMAHAGAHVVINGRDAAAAKSRADELAKQGLAASPEAFDTTDAPAAAAAVTSIVGRLGRLDILVNNAGIPFRRALEETSDEDFERVISTNLTACFRLCRLAVPTMKAGKFGRIIMTASITSLIGRPTLAAYTAAKGGLSAMTRTLAAELGPHGITCNAIVPGYIDTELVKALKANPAFDAYIRARTPLGRWGTPNDIAGPAVFLASEAAAYVTGHLLVVDGGMSAVV